MNKPLFSSARLLSMAFAALLTLGILGGIDQLAQHDAASPQMAQASAARA
jgi:hypothetical protein